MLYFFSPPPPDLGLYDLVDFSFVAVGWMILLTIGGRGVFGRPHMISLFAIWQLIIAESSIPKRVYAQYSLFTWDTND